MSSIHHVLGEHVGDDGLLHGQHLSDDDVAAGDGKAPPGVFVLEGYGVAHHRIEGVLVGHVWQLGPAGGEGGGMEAWTGVLLAYSRWMSMASSLLILSGAFLKKFSA